MFGIILIIGFIILIPFFVISLIVLISNKIKKEEYIKEDFSKIIKTIYIYALLFILLCTIIIYAVNLFNSAINIALPLDNNVEINFNENSVDTYHLNLEIVNLITSFGALTVTLPLFIYFNKKAKKI